MAEVVRADRAHRHGNARYCWPRYADGYTYRLTRGEDFTCAAKSAGSAAREWARRHGRRLRVVVSGDSVYVTALDVGKS